MSDPILSDDLIRLRRATAADGPAIAEAVQESVPELSPWMPWAHPSYSVIEAEAWIARADPGYLIEADGALVGACGLHPTGDHAEIGYWVRTSCTGRGYATAAARLLVHRALATLELSKVVIRVDPSNHPSQAVARKAGGVLLPELHTHPHDDGTVHRLLEFEFRRDGAGA